MVVEDLLGLFFLGQLKGVNDLQFRRWSGLRYDVDFGS